MPNDFIAAFAVGAEKKMVFHDRAGPRLQCLQQHALGAEQDVRDSRPCSVGHPLGAAVELRCLYLPAEADRSGSIR